MSNYIVELTDEDLSSEEAFDKHNALWFKATAEMLKGKSFNVDEWEWNGNEWKNKNNN